MLLAASNRYVSDHDHQAFLRRPRQPYAYSERPEPCPPAQAIDHARRAAFRAYGQNRGYPANFIGPRFMWAHQRQLSLQP